MHPKPIRSLALALMLAGAPCALAHGGPGDRDDVSTRSTPAASPGTDQLPAGATTLPPDTPATNVQPSGIGSISDTPGSMSDGSPAGARREAPASADHMPGVLPRDTKPDGSIGNMEDVTGSMGDGSRSGQ
ncbi:MAG TPA: hypothetical protein VMB76_18660 [Casimicrobiaceae bacterium]|jgi:hypothetical protein|nr:hypothetical protein [Casimicrobiaceae bacterium]